MIKMIVIIGLLFFGWNMYLNASPGPPTIEFFEGSIQEAQQLAREQHKFIFIDAYASWCGPCKLMAKNVFTNKKVGEFYNENYICLKIDMEKGEGPQLARTYSVKAYPTLLIIDPDGKLLDRTVGYQSGNDLIKFGKNNLKEAIAN